MVNMANIIPAKHQHDSIVIVSMLTLAFSSKHSCAYMCNLTELLARLYTVSFVITFWCPEFMLIKYEATQFLRSVFKNTNQ